MAAEVRALDVAQHEAAHVVVGVALGLRLRRAVVGSHWDAGEWLLGYAWFAADDVTHREALSLMYAAGIAWDRSLRIHARSSSGDAAALRELVPGRHGRAAVVRAASALLGALTPEHARVTRALLEGDITGRDIARMCEG